MEEISASDVRHVAFLIHNEVSRLAKSVEILRSALQNARDWIEGNQFSRLDILHAIDVSFGEVVTVLSDPNADIGGGTLLPEGSGR